MEDNKIFGNYIYPWDRVHVPDYLPPTVPVMWVITVGGAEGGHPVPPFIRSVQAGGPVRSLDTWQQWWDVFPPWMLGHTSLTHRKCWGFPPDLPLTLTNQDWADNLKPEGPTWLSPPGGASETVLGDQPGAVLAWLQYHASSNNCSSETGCKDFATFDQTNQELLPQASHVKKWYAGQLIYLVRDFAKHSLVYLYDLYAQFIILHV